MCGIIGIVGNSENNIATSLYDGLLVLQHRGQDAAGIITSDDDYIFLNLGAIGIVFGLKIKLNFTSIIGFSVSYYFLRYFR